MLWGGGFACDRFMKHGAPHALLDLLPHHMGEVARQGRRGTGRSASTGSPSALRAPPPYDGGGIDFTMNNSNRLLYFLPLLTLAIMAGFFAWSLSSGRDPAAIGSALVGRPAPRFAAPP